MGMKLVLSPYEKHRLKVFQNRMIWRILGPRREEVVGG
jgi:hypothetical protein